MSPRIASNLPDSPLCSARTTTWAAAVQKSSRSALYETAWSRALQLVRSVVHLFAAWLICSPSHHHSRTHCMPGNGLLLAAYYLSLINTLTAAFYTRAAAALRRFLSGFAAIATAQHSPVVAHHVRSRNFAPRLLEFRRRSKQLRKIFSALNFTLVARLEPHRTTEPAVRVSMSVVVLYSVVVVVVFVSIYSSCSSSRTCSRRRSRCWRYRD